MEEAGDDEGPHFVEMDPQGRFGRWDQVLGRGAFKVVYKAFDTQEGTEVAWNQVRVSELMSTKDAENKEERDRLFAEIRVLKALKHKNIMSFFDSWYDPKTYTVNFITELFTSGTLRQYRKRHKHIDEEVLKRWAWQILCGLVYLHGHNPPIIHRDLKCDNIFINGSDGVVKIGDLGLATMLRSRTAPQSVLGTPEFMAPELYEEEYDDRVDVYSFGMCLLELSTMEYPYAECKNAAQIYRKVSLGVRPAGLQKVLSPELGEFINLCISARDARPRARQLLKHSYFDSIRKDKALVSSRSDAALAAAGGAGGDGLSEYGSIASGPVSRTASSLNEMVAAVGSAGHPGPGAGSGGGPLSGPPSVGSVAGVPPVHPLSRSISAEAVHSADKAHSVSDSASVRSQRSNASELAAVAGMLENIAEESEATETGEDSPGIAGSPAIGSRQASARGSPQPAIGSPAKPGSPTSSDGCRCDATERRFSVKGNWLHGDKRIQLRLRICEPTGITRTVEFEFDVAVDTASDVASEMVADLELTPEDASVIAVCIRDELGRLSALPEINAHASMSLAKAAQVLESSLTSSALEQAHSSGGARDFAALTNGLNRTDTASSSGGASYGRMFSGRFSEEVVPQPPLAAALPLPTPAPPLAAVLELQVNGAADAGQRSSSARSSLEKEHPAVVPGFSAMRPSLSTCSLASTSSVASMPQSVASGTSHQPLESGHASYAAAAAAAVGAPHPPSLARLSPRLGGSAVSSLPPPRPVSPLGAPQAASPAEMPSPSQRVMRSNSLDAFSLLSRTSSSMPPGRDAVASPLGIGSGALSPSSGILSPPATVHEKRIGLHQLFENLQDLAAAQTGSPVLEGTAVPNPAGSRAPLQGSTSHGALEGSGAAADSALLRPRSEACLASLPYARASPFTSLSASTVSSAPTAGGGLAAAVALGEAGTIASPTCASSTVSPRSAASQAAVEAMQRLDLQSSAPLPAAHVAPALGRASAPAFSAPASKLPSRDTSPGRDGSLSPTRPPSGPAAISGGGSGADLAAQGCGKRPPIKDKEALRRQAAESMKAVELRSLNLLEFGLGMGRAARGVPMAAAKTGIGGGAMGAAGAGPGSAGGTSNGIPAIPTMQQPPPPQQQQPVPAQQQQPTKPQHNSAVAVAASGVAGAAPPPPGAAAPAAVHVPH